jgi:hypothetical protein
MRNKLTGSSPIQKSQMTSGQYLLILIGNNDDGFPFAYQRNFSLKVAPQQTYTVSDNGRWTSITNANFRSTRPQLP